MTMSIQNIIAIQLKQLMQDNQMTIKRFSKLSGVAEDIITNIINEDMMPELDMIEKLCKVFDISVCQFFDVVINDIFKNQAIA